MPSVPIVPNVKNPLPFQLPTELGDRFQAQFGMKQQMIQSRQDARDNQFTTSFNLWQSNKLKDGDFIKQIDTLKQTADSPVESKKWDMKKGEVSNAIATKNIQVEVTKIDTLAATDGTDPVEVYNKYSNLSKVAAKMGLQDIAANIMLRAAIQLKTLKAEARAGVAEGRAAARDKDDADLQNMRKELLTSIHTTPPPPTPKGPLLPSGQELTGPLSTPEGDFIPDSTAEQGYIFIPRGQKVAVKNPPPLPTQKKKNVPREIFTPPFQGNF